MIKNNPTPKKGQIFTWDIVLATSVFLVVLGILVFQWTSSVSEMLSSEAQYEISWLSSAVSEQLVRTPGNPINWSSDSTTWNNVVYGLADYEIAGNETRALDRVLDADKFFLFLNQSQNYSKIRNKLLGSAYYDYYSEISCLDGEELDCLNGLQLDYVDEGSVKCANNATLYAVGVSNPAALWFFSEGVDTTAADLSGNNNNGEISGASWSSGRYGSGLSFDGINDNVTVPHSNTLNINGSISITAWVNLASIGGISHNRPIVSKVGNGDYSHADSYLLMYGWGNDLFFTLGNTSYWADYTRPNLIRTVRYVIPDALNTWHFIAATWDGSVAYLYVDGELKSEERIQGEMRTNTHPITIGQDGTHYFNGSIDEVGIYNHSLTSYEVERLYQRTRTIYTDKNLAGVWHFSEGKGNTTQDNSGNGNNGVIIGTNWSNGKNGNCAGFDGFNDYIEVSNYVPFNPYADDYSVSVWIKPNTVVGEQYFVSLSNDTYSPVWGVELRDSAVRVYGRDKDLNAYELFTPINNISAGNWQRITYTKNQSTGTIYVNGVNVTSGVVNTVGTWGSMKRVVFGGVYRPVHNVTPMILFNGSIDDVRIYSRALAPEEVYRDYSGENSYCLLGRNTSINDTKYIAYDTKTFTFSGGKGNQVLYEDIPKLNETARITIAVYRQLNKG